jgi:hypothetical protein
MVRSAASGRYCGNNRSWSDAALREAVTNGRTWQDVLTALGRSSRAGGERALIKAHALRLGLDLSHLGRPGQSADACELKPALPHLRRAAESLAATWFLTCGRNVAFPAEPDAYDLLVDMPAGLKRVHTCGLPPAGLAHGGPPRRRECVPARGRESYDVAGIHCASRSLY